MKGYIHAVIVLCTCAIFASPALAKEIAKGPQSSARVVLKLNPSGEERKYDSLSSAFHQLYEEYGSIGFYDTQVLDYSTFGKGEKLIDAERAYFLVNADKAEDAGSDFKVVAFASRKAAKAAQAKLGGDLRDFEDTWSAVAEHWGVDLKPQPAKEAAPKQEAAHSQREQRRVRQPDPAACFT